LALMGILYPADGPFEKGGNYNCDPGCGQEEL